MDERSDEDKSSDSGTDDEIFESDVKCESFDLDSQDSENNTYIQDSNFFGEDATEW